MFIHRPFRTLNTIEIDPEALIHNVRLYQSLRPDLSICPVLKSNAYGHGLTLVAEILDPLRLDYLIVDSIYEAYQLKDAKIKTPVLILGHTHPENFHRKLPFHFTAFDEASLRLHAHWGHPLHIEVDTGMSRMGFPLDELPQTLRLVKEIKANLVGLFSHLATADEESEDYLKFQESQFEEALKMTRAAGFNPQFVHLGNSAGSLKSKIDGLSMGRLGVSLYGIGSLEGLRPVAEVRSTIVAIRELKGGESISYGCTYKADRPMKIAVVPFGYYEGLPRSLGNKGHMEVQGQDRPIVGRVCMNHTMIDVTGLDLKVGDEVKVYSRVPGSQASFEAQSKKADTISYELMVRLSESVRRV